MAVSKASEDNLSVFSATNYAFIPEETLEALETENKKGFLYLFGIDGIELKKRTMAESSAKITAPVKVPKGSVIELDARFYEDEHSSVEFSIIDETGETPIVPRGISYIRNERIFPGLDTRFPADLGAPVVIQKDGAPVDMTFEEAKEKTDGLYTVSYKPKEGYTYTAKTDEVRIKVVLRVYGKESMPYVKDISIFVRGAEFL